VLGIDITRSPHPRALLIFSPLLAGGLFVIGYAYFCPDLIERFFAFGHMDSPVRLAVRHQLCDWYDLATAVVFPFMIFMYSFGYFGIAILISLTRSRMGIPQLCSNRLSRLQRQLLFGVGYRSQLRRRCTGQQS
jgi:hypothetical protein